MNSNFLFIELSFLKLYVTSTKGIFTQYCSPYWHKRNITSFIFYQEKDVLQ